MHACAWVGLALITVARCFADFPYSLYSHADFWLNSPALILIRLGIVLVSVAVAHIWTAGSPACALGLFRQIGRHSLLVYWVHVELVYGRWFWFCKERLTASQCLLASAVLIAAMYWVSTLNIGQRVGQWTRSRFRKASGPKDGLCQ
jgi:hypothetical protein